MKRHMTRLALAGMLAMAWTAAAETLSVEDVVKKTNHASYYQGKDGRARVKMTITDAQSRTREREFTILRKNMDEEDREQRFYVYFRRPADVRDMVFMVWKHTDKDDDRWMYLPALDVSKRIAASDERTSFVGSQYFYEDVSGRNTDEDHHELVETTDAYYVLKNTPKDPAGVEFDSYTMWIHKTTFLPVKVAFEKNGEVYRENEILEVKQIQGYPTVTKSRMKDLRSGANTVNEYSAVEFDVGLPEDIFSERYLRRAPREYIK